MPAGRYLYPRVEVELETGERLAGAMAFVFNIPQYALGLNLAHDAAADDGLLDVYVFERPGLLALASSSRGRPLCAACASA